jgi:hypothetical protein
MEARSDGGLVVPGAYQDGGPHGALYGQPPGKPPVLDPRGACADALAAFLRTLTFTRWGDLAANTPFNLKDVREEWPEPSVVLAYPSASIVDVDDATLEGHSLTPTALEETYGSYGPGTMLWKVAEAVVTFQVDFWSDDIPTREAIAARLPSAFSPGEDGSRVVICGNSRYWGRPVRATLVSYRRMDTGASVYPRERRLSCRIRCEVDAVDLRCSMLVAPSLDVRASDTEDPASEPEAGSASCG